MIRSMIERGLNKLGRPFGILPFSRAWDPPEDAPRRRQEVFETIFRKNYWGSSESVSGPGSELARTAKYREQLAAFLEDYRIRSLFDAPCGDLNWMGEVLARVPVQYIGGDISTEVLAAARRRHPELDLRHFDICADTFPDVQLWHCRDAFLHLSFRDIWSALERVSVSNVELVLLSTHRARFMRNTDVRTGGARPLDLHRPPFNFPTAIRYLDDSRWPEFPRSVGVWNLKTIREALRRRGSACSGI